MEWIVWEDSMNIYVQNIDEQKKKIAEHINKIYKKHEEKAEPRVLFELLHDLGEGLRMHFILEEKIMQTVGYPELTEHRKLHKYFIRKTLAMRRLLSDDQENIKEDALAFLGNWLINHICTEDQRFGPYARTRIFIDQHKRNKRMR